VSFSWESTLWWAITSHRRKTRVKLDLDSGRNRWIHLINRTQVQRLLDTLREQVKAELRVFSVHFTSYFHED
jgi:hypothetical protein